MKHKIIFLTIIFFTAFFSKGYSQSENAINQEFIVTDFKILTPSTIVQKSGITVSFDLKMTTVLEEYFKNPYYLKLRLKNDTNTVYFENSNYRRVYAKADFYDKNVAKEEEIKFFVPYDKINLSEGRYLLDFEIIANDENNDFGVVFSEKIETKLPKLFDYKDQTFEISSFKIINNQKYYNLRGLEVDFFCNYKFTADKIIGVSRNESLKSYSYFVELYDKKSGEIIFFYENNQNFEADEVDDLRKKITFFIPYHDIILEKGTHNLQAKLCVYGDITQSNYSVISETNFTITQPQVYMARLHVKHMEVAYQKYDTPNIFGRIFSRKGSNVGKGYPDIYWKLQVGKLSKYISEISKNSFAAYSGLTYFTTTDNDPLSIDIYDYDQVGKNDLISSIGIKNTKGENYLKMDNLKNKNLDDLSFDFQKILPPHLLQKSITITPHKKQNVSGILVDFSYQLSPIFDTDKFQIIAYEKNTDSEPTVINSKFSETLENTQITNENLSGTSSFFIPYVDLNKNSKIGFGLKSTFTARQITPFFNDEKIELPKEIDDVKIELSGVEEGQNGDYYGVFLNFEAQIPDYYQKKFKISEMPFYFKVKELQNKTDLTQIVQHQNIVNNDKYFYLDNENKAKIFIPYFQLAQYSGKTINLEIETVCTQFDNQMILGKNIKKINLPVPELEVFQPKKIIVKFRKNDFYENIGISVQHGLKMSYEIGSKPYSKKLIWNSIPHKILYHKNDNLKISVLGIDKFGLGNTIEEWEISRKKSRKKIKLKKAGSDIRKVIIVL